MKGYLYSFLGNAYLNRFDREKASYYFKNAINCNTKNVVAIYNYGLILLQDGYFKQGLELFLKAKELNDKKASRKSFLPAAINRTMLLQKNIPLAIASSYWRLNEMDKAIDMLEGLRKEYDYINPNTLATLGYFYIVVKNYEKAEEITLLALKDNENYYPAWDNMGQIYLEQNDYDKAKEYFEKSISINPKSVDSLYHLGIIEEAKENKEKAKEYFKKALGCNITSLNTITKEGIENKLKELD